MGTNNYYINAFVTFEKRRLPRNFDESLISCSILYKILMMIIYFPNTFNCK